MSDDLTVYLARQSMPRPRDWAKAIVESGFPAELVADFDVDDYSGFVRCRFEGADSGFDYESGTVEYVDELDLPNEVDFSVTLGGRDTDVELASSVVSAAVLCHMSGGVLVDPHWDVSIAAEDAISWARERLEELDV